MSLLDDIPGVDLATVTTSESCDVALNDGCQSAAVGDARDPAGQLRVPNFDKKSAYGPVQV